MVDYEKYAQELASGEEVVETPAAVATASIFRRVYGWMALGLAVSGIVAWWVAASGLWQTVLAGPGWTVCIIAELALVVVLSASLRKLPPAAACAMFLVYSAVNGLTLSVVLIAFELALVTRVFFITAAMFGALAIWGTRTKDDLSGIGSMCFMGLVGIIVASIVNIFMRSTAFDWWLSLAGIVVFCGLTMYDAQKIKRLAAMKAQLDAPTANRLAIAGALELYLDFVNLFLNLLRIMGRRK